MNYKYELFQILNMDYVEASNYLCHEEIETYNTLLPAFQKQRFLFSRYNLKKLIIGLVPNIAYRDINTALNDYGEPLIIEEQKIYFSISYSDDYCIVAVSSERIGVDLEMLKSRANLLGKISTQQEMSIIRGDDVFLNSYLIWTLKEAAMKIDQSSFSCLDYTVILKKKPNLFIIQTPKYLLKVANYARLNAIFSIAQICHD